MIIKLIWYLAGLNHLLLVKKWKNECQVAELLIKFIKYKHFYSIFMKHINKWI